MPKKSPATVSALAPADYNPRTISDDQLERLQDSLSRLGDLSGVIYNRRTGNLVGGHQRAKALPEASTITLETKYRRPTKTGTKAEGYVLTPEGERFAYREVDWDLNTEKLANVTANRLHGDFDWDSLANLASDLEKVDIDLSDAGFSEDEVAALFASMDTGTDSPLDDNQAEETPVPEPPQDPVSKPGDVWILGKHRLTCGLAEDHKPPKDTSLVLTDPPYNVGGKSASYVADLRKAYQDIKDADWDQDFDPRAFLDTLDNVKGSIYIFCSHYTFPQYLVWGAEWCQFHGYLVWCKPNPIPSMAKRHWTWATELIFYGTISEHTFNFPEEGHALNWLEFTSPTHEHGHPTQKPTPLIEHLMKHSSSPGHTVYDPFSGSGTTLVVAEQLDRICHAVEMDPKWVDVTVERWSELTGKQAKLKGKPLKTFDQVAEERE